MPLDPAVSAAAFSAKPGGTGMDPLLGSALIQTGGGLLGALFSPSVKKQLKWQRESDQKQMAWKAGKIASTLKPQTPYYSSGNLPQLGDASMRAIMGNLAQRMGPELMAKWGINPMAPPVAPANVTGGMPPQLGPAQPPMPTQGFPGQDMLLRKYGAMGPGRM
jgi:hypothetical protein